MTTKQALLIHGWGNKKEYYSPSVPTASNSYWFPWLSKQLMIRDTHTVSIEMPNSYYPEYEIWKKELERFLLDENTILIGHSYGGHFTTSGMGTAEFPELLEEAIK